MRVGGRGPDKSNSFFMKVGAANVLLKLNYLQSRVDTIQKDYQTFYRKIKCILLNFRGVQNGYDQDFQYLMISIPFFHEAATLMQSYLPDKLESRKKIFFLVFLMERHYYTLPSRHKDVAKTS